MFVVVCLLIDCNNFFYKFILWVPHDHLLLKFRIFLWGFAAMATSKEWYEYVNNRNCHRLGPFAWLTFYVSAMALSGLVKIAGPECSIPLPTWVHVMWSCLFATWLYLLQKAIKNGKGEKRAEFDPYNPRVEVSSAF